MAALKVVYVLLSALLLVNAPHANGVLPPRAEKLVRFANRDGPYLGLVTPSHSALKAILQSPDFKPSNLTIDAAGKRFHFGAIAEKKVILVLTGLSMINAAVTTQLLLTLFRIGGVVHFGVAGNANPGLNLGDVTIPYQWSHSALWSWQRYGKGPKDELPLESSGDFTRAIGYLKFSDYTISHLRPTFDNLLNNVWYQPEEIFPVDGTPEVRQHAFWVNVDPHYFEVSKKLVNFKLQRCINSTACLPTTPKVAIVERGTSGSIYLDNEAYRNFIAHKFRVSPVDMESASVALVSLQQKVPFIAVRALSDLAGGDSKVPAGVETFASKLSAYNAAKVVVELVKEI